jgi:ribbon-helix-helix protein
MAAEIQRFRDRASETEKITINLGYVDLGHIDLLVQEGFYSNRTDFIRTAIRNQRPIARRSGNRSCGIRWSLVLGTIRARISRPSKPPVKSFTSRCSGSPPLPPT